METGNKIKLSLNHVLIYLERYQKKNLVYYILKGYIEVKCVVNSTIVRKIVFLNTIIFCYGFLESMKPFSSIYSALTIATDIINSNYKFRDSIINFYYIPCRP